MSTENKPENPPAFPSAVLFDQGVHETSGMSLRDYFAAKATDLDIQEYLFDENDLSREEAKFKYADAMLKARAGK